MADSRFVRKHEGTPMTLKNGRVVNVKKSDGPVMPKVQAQKFDLSDLETKTLAQLEKLMDDISKVSTLKYSFLVCMNFGQCNHQPRVNWTSNKQPVNCPSCSGPRQASMTDFGWAKMECPSCKKSWCTTKVVVHSKHTDGHKEKCMHGCDCEAVMTSMGPKDYIEAQLQLLTVKVQVDAVRAKNLAAFMAINQKK
jgi:hypothetical protein